MKSIFVPGIRVEIPIIGFGCGSLTGTDSRNAARLLQTAFDSGVRHFDVARYYGYGETEAIVGAFVKSRRSEMTITTKFGVQPPGRRSLSGIALSAGRSFVQLIPMARPFMQRRARALVTSGAFGVNDARRSLETSLRELRTDYVDFFLLHDYTTSDQAPHDLLKFLEDAVLAGKIRYFGIGTGIENILRSQENQPALCRVIQFENSVLVQNSKRLLGHPTSQLVVTHGSLGASYRSISSFLNVNPEKAKTWSTELGVDCTEGDVLTALMLNYAVQANPNGLVLFSSRNAERVAKNVRAVLQPNLTREQISSFGRLVERESVPLVS